MIFDHIKTAMVVDPTFEDEIAINAFDLFDTGANFKLKIRRVDGYPKYDRSEFDRPSALSEDQIEDISKQVFSITDLVAPDKFKTYEDLEKRLNQVLDLNTRETTRIPAAEPEARKEKEPETQAEEKSVWDADEGDSDLDYFAKLAADE